MKKFILGWCLLLSTQAWALNFNINRELVDQKRCAAYLYNNDYVSDAQVGWNLCGWNDVKTLKCGIELMEKEYIFELLPALNMCKRNQEHQSFLCAEKLYKGGWVNEFLIAQNTCEWHGTSEIECAKKKVLNQQSPSLISALLNECSK